LLRAFTCWALLVLALGLGFAMVGTASLMVGNGAAIRTGLLIWLVAAVLSLAGMPFALRRSAAKYLPAALSALPLLAALFATRYVMGVPL
jgi:hypothetical protein